MGAEGPASSLEGRSRRALRRAARTEARVTGYIMFSLSTVVAVVVK